MTPPTGGRSARSSTSARKPNVAPDFELNAARAAVCAGVNAEAPTEHTANSDAHVKLAATTDRIAELFTELGECFGDLGILQKGVAECRPKSVMDGTPGDQPSASTMQSRRELLTANDIAKLVRCDAKTIRNWRSQGMLPPAITFGSLVRWRTSDIDAWIEERMEGRS